LSWRFFCACDYDYDVASPSHIGPLQAAIKRSRIGIDQPAKDDCSGNPRFGQKYQKPYFDKICLKKIQDYLLFYFSNL